MLLLLLPLCRSVHSSKMSTRIFNSSQHRNGGCKCCVCMLLNTRHKIKCKMRENVEGKKIWSIWLSLFIYCFSFLRFGCLVVWKNVLLSQADIRARAEYRVLQPSSIFDICVSVYVWVSIFFPIRCLCRKKKWYSPEKVSNKLTITMGFSAHIILSLHWHTRSFSTGQKSSIEFIVPSRLSSFVALHCIHCCFSTSF